MTATPAPVVKKETAIKGIPLGMTGDMALQNVGKRMKKKLLEQARLEEEEKKERIEKIKQANKEREELAQKKLRDERKAVKDQAKQSQELKKKQQEDLKEQQEAQE